MGLILFKHNQKAYEAANRLMEEKGRAAVIHPTGTGKTYIAFKLAEEHPDSRILWLSPSEYIYRTQLEQLKKEGAEAFSNISFLTYARLMRNESVIAVLCPDYIVLDEFHRCGAIEWGRSVEKLLTCYPKAKVLGLSATNVRYLDHQRDMAEELFDGQIASEMTLGEVIAKGILPAPTYVISMYSYREELERIEQKAASAKNRGHVAFAGNSAGSGNENIAGDILEELRRALEQAEGLDKIFARYMKKNGKYIVFCSDKEHMEEMVEQAKEWFRPVDKNPHIYTVYYDNPETDRVFAEFKVDESEHLKLLYCIDMLNEGVHVENIDGVILLRPTVSPILYLQQIGRALSAADRRNPIIFDIVNNFDNLYSIDSLQTEIEEAFALMERSEICTAAERQRFREQFRIVDETRDCRLLFEQLRRSLSAPWDIYYREAEKYYAEHGNLKIPKNYVTGNGISLGIWIMTQRRLRAGKATTVRKADAMAAGNLSEEQIAKLDAIGMEWECGSVRSWNRACEALECYRKEFGNLDVKVSYVTEDGFALGKWVSNARSRYSRGELSEEQTGQLESLGMIWDRHVRQWEENYQAAAAYYRMNGNLLVPRGYRTENGLALGTWLANQRRIKAGRKKGAAPLGESQIERLNAIEMVWNET